MLVLNSSTVRRIHARKIWVPALVVQTGLAKTLNARV